MCSAMMMVCFVAQQRNCQDRNDDIHFFTSQLADAAVNSRHATAPLLLLLYMAALSMQEGVGEVGYGWACDINDVLLDDILFHKLLQMNDIIVNIILKPNEPLV